MIEASQLISFFIFTFVASVTPGPANIAILTKSSRGDYRSIISYSLGILLGFFFVLSVAAALYMIGIKIVSSDLTFIKIIGSIYFIYLAYKIWTSGPIDNTNNELKNSKWTKTFLSGLLIHPISSKAWLFVFLSYGTFITNVQGLKIFLFSFIFLFNAFISMIPWGVAGYVMKLYSPPKAVIYLNYVSAISIIILIISLWV